MKPLDSCSLCISQARNPVCCSEGHLFCKECILDSILSQKKVLKEEADRISKHNSSVMTREEREEMEEKEKIMSKFLKSSQVIQKSSETKDTGKATGTLFAVYASVLAARSNPKRRTIEIKGKGGWNTLPCKQKTPSYKVFYKV